MKNVYQKFICAVILVCSQIYMLLYDVRVSFGLMDLFIMCLFCYLFMKRKITLKDCVAYVGLLVTGTVLCSMFHPFNILRTGTAITLAQIFFIASNYLVYYRRRNKDRYIKNGYIHNEHDQMFLPFSYRDYILFSSNKACKRMLLSYDTEASNVSLTF